MIPRRCAAVAGLLLLVAPLRDLVAQDRGAGALDQLVRGIPVTARVLMIGAHPDDENTALIAFLARGRRVETAYLSLTRGDGGQNLLGNELGETLGAIRTEELLAARRLDGGRQYFTRAFDFGFSKTAEETFKHWERDSLLGDIVTVVRAFRPHIVVAVFSGTPADGHGHHQVSGILAREAYDVAGDTVRFPVRKYGRPWEPLKFYRRRGGFGFGPNGGFGGAAGGGGAAGAGGRGGRGGGRGGDVLQLGAVVVPNPTPQGVAMNVGEFDPVLGRSYAEISGESRAQHRSQGFGGAQQRKGVVMDYEFREGSRVNESTPAAEEKSLFEGVDTSFARLARAAPPGARLALERMSPLVDSARAALDLKRPELLVHWLARAAELADVAREAVPLCANTVESVMVRAGMTPKPCDAAALDLDASLNILKVRAANAALAAAGIAVEATAPQELLAFGDSMPVNVTVYNRGREPVKLAGLKLSGTLPQAMDTMTIAPDSAARLTRSVIGLNDTRPWWVAGRMGDMFARHESPPDGLARVSMISMELVPGTAVPEDTRRESDVEVTLRIAGATVSTSVGPITFRSSDPVMGEQNRPVGGVPAVTLAFDRGLNWVPAGKQIDRLMRLALQSYSSSPRTFSFKVVSPPGIRVDSVPASVTLGPYEEKEIFLRLRGSLKEGRYEFGVVAVTETGRYYEGFRIVQYPHIRPVRMYRQSGMYLQAVDVTVPATLSVAYVQGVGDFIAPFLRDLMIPVSILTPDELPVADLSRFSTVVVGTRAYQAHRELLAYNARLLDFARKGGTLVVQYGQAEMTAPGVLPYSIGRNNARVTEEDAPVTVLDPRSRLLNWPNKIGEADWSDWLQERSLYMPTVIDPHFATPVEMHDPGEPENKGALLITPLGKGTYVYTTLSLFRQIPGGVPGGVRLFVNALSAGLEPPAPKKIQP
ncbi:MAG: PIG-L family deacetylase [Gemmatimonadales bacterium]